MRLRWPFRRQTRVLVLPAAMPLRDFQAMTIGNDVIALGEQASEQAKFLSIADRWKQITLPDGRQVEAGVIAEAFDLPAFEEPKRQP